MKLKIEIKQAVHIVFLTDKAIKNVSLQLS